jgi:hypothetical protein
VSSSLSQFVHRHHHSHHHLYSHYYWHRHLYHITGVNFTIINIIIIMIFVIREAQGQLYLYFTVSQMKFCGMWQHSLIGRWQCFEGSYPLPFLLHWICTRLVPLKRWCLSTKLYSVISLMTAVIIEVCFFCFRCYFAFSEYFRFYVLRSMRKTIMVVWEVNSHQGFRRVCTLIPNHHLKLRVQFSHKCCYLSIRLQDVTSRTAQIITVLINYYVLIILFCWRELDTLS